MQVVGCGDLVSNRRRRPKSSALEFGKLINATGETRKMGFARNSIAASSEMSILLRCLSDADSRRRRHQWNFNCRLLCDRLFDTRHFRGYLRLIIAIWKIRSKCWNFNW